jgi:hypothetical protein
MDSGTHASTEEILHANVVDAARKWKHQGARSKWTSPISLALWDAVDKLEQLEKHHGTQAV